MPWGFAAAAVGTIAGAAISSDASRGAANTQADAARNATQTQLDMFNKTQANLQPYMQQGQVGLNNMNALLADPSSLTKLPGYQFQLDQGIDAIQNSAARGGLTGNTLKALSDYGQGTASSYYNNYWNQLMQMVNLGQTSAAGVGNIGASTANSISANQIGAGNALAAGQVGSASAIGNAVNGGLQNWLLYNSMQQPGSGMVVSPGGAGIDPYGYLGGAATAGDYSDARLKTDVLRIGARDDGLGVYEFRYVWGGPMRVGLMAHEVLALYPQAVSSDDAGFLKVDYSKV